MKLPREHSQPRYSATPAAREHGKNQSGEGIASAQLKATSETIVQSARMEHLAQLKEMSLHEVQQHAPEDEELLQGKFTTLQRAPEDEEELQGKFESLQRASDEEELMQGKLQSTDVGQKKENNTGMPDNLKQGVEQLSGVSMDDVRVHYNSARPAQVQAHAYTQGTNIHVAPGQEQHLAHEAWHVVQQSQGRVQPTTQLEDGTAINDDSSLEQEADEMGSRAVR